MACAFISELGVGIVCSNVKFRYENSCHLIEKTCTRETLNLLTCADSCTDIRKSDRVKQKKNHVSCVTCHVLSPKPKTQQLKSNSKKSSEPPKN